MLSHAANFNLSLASDSSAILAMPANGTMFPSTELDFPSHSGFNLTERLRIANESRTARQAKLKSLGYQILPNGFATLSGASENGAHALSAKESTRLTEEECKSFSEECRALYQGGQLDTFVAWDSLVGDGLDRLRKEGLVKTRDRWDLREAKVLEYARALDDVVRALSLNHVFSPSRGLTRANRRNVSRSWSSKTRKNTTFNSSITTSPVVKSARSDL